MTDHLRRRTRAFGALAVLVTIGLGFLAPPAGAQAGPERITAYDVEITVEGSGSILVTENIDYNFGTNDLNISSERHGIYRDIPVRISYDGRYDRLYALKVLSVSGSPGTPAKYTVNDVGRKKRIKIGDANQTVTGAHHYTITYRVAAALNGHPEYDELDWNAVGGDWAVPIERATVRVTAPAAVTSVACFGGVLGSLLACSDSNRAGAIAGFSQGRLAPGEGLTVGVGFAKGAVPPPAPKLEERPDIRRSFTVNPVTAGLSLLLLAGIVAGFSRLAWRTGRDRRFAGSAVDAALGSADGREEAVGLLERGERPVEFVPPDGIRPGQVGTLVDERANTLDVTATIVDLAVRGYLRIDEIPKHGWFGKPDWALTKLKPNDDLLPYERELMKGLFASGQEIKLSGLRNTFASKLKIVENALYDDALGQGWFVARPDKVRRHWRLIGVGALVLALLIVLVVAAGTHAGLVVLPLPVGAVLLLVSANHMPRRTAKGTGVLRQVEGFRRFIEESEKERARFAEQQHLFSEYLPYAIVFGVTEKWAQAFAGLEGQLPEPSWYGGSQAFTAAGFSHSIDGFAVTTAGTISSTPSGSGSGGFSGGGGGGFSGGGGGGGGGGSW